MLGKYFSKILFWDLTSLLAKIITISEFLYLKKKKDHQQTKRPQFSLEPKWLREFICQRPTIAPILKDVWSPL